MVDTTVAALAAQHPLLTTAPRFCVFATTDPAADPDSAHDRDVRPLLFAVQNLSPSEYHVFGYALARAMTQRLTDAERAACLAAMLEGVAAGLTLAEEHRVLMEESLIVRPAADAPEAEPHA